MFSRVIDIDELTGVTTTMAIDEMSGEVTLHSEQECAAITDDSRSRFNMFDERANWKGDMHHVARIPMVVYAEMQRLGITRDSRKFKQWLNDADNRMFRTRPGVI